MLRGGRGSIKVKQTVAYGRRHSSLHLDFNAETRVRESRLFQFTITLLLSHALRAGCPIACLTPGVLHKSKKEDR